MNFLGNLRNPPEFAGSRAMRKLPAGGPSASKAAFDMVPVGVTGRPQYPDTDIESLQGHYKRNEMVYAAIDIRATSACDPRLMVQNRGQGEEWTEDPGHPLRRLLMRPNEMMDEAAFIRSWIVNADTAGKFYAEIVRAQGSRLPAELHPLNPALVAPIPGKGRGGIAAYEFKQGSQKVIIKAEDMLVYTMYNPTSKWQGLSPLQVCLGSVDADSAQTDFIRAFFNNAGVPSGMLKIKGRKIDEEESQRIRAKWHYKYGRAMSGWSGLNPTFGGLAGRPWGNQHDVAIMDEDAEYQKIGSGLNELESQAIRSFTESRIAMAFGVPPLIIYSYTGLLRATYSNLKEAWRGFWDATLNPLYKEYRAWLTWSLLPEFVDEELIYGERVRLNWDMTQVAALQEDVKEKEQRARENFKAGGITLNEYRSTIGAPADPNGDYYLRLKIYAPSPYGVAPTATADDALAAEVGKTMEVDEVTAGAKLLMPPVESNGHSAEEVPA